MQKRWEVVLNRKSAVIETKQKHMTDLLNKKFKKEKAMVQRLEDAQAVKMYDDEKRAEKYEEIRKRRDIQDQ